MVQIGDNNPIDIFYLVENNGNETYYKKWNGLFSFNIESENNVKILKLTEIEGDSIKIHLKTTGEGIKHRKKSFKKWMMSKGYSRDESEEVIKLVSEMNGKIPYASIYYYILLGGKLKSDVESKNDE